MTSARPSIVIVVTDPADWPHQNPEVDVVSAKDYLTDAAYAERSAARVINLCRSYRYQKAGYYVSLLGHARGHHPAPSLAAIQEAKSATVLRLVSDELAEIAAEALQYEQASEVVLHIYFGQESLGRYPRLAKAVFGRLPLLLMRVVFTRREKKDSWDLTSCAPTTLPQIPAEQSELVQSAFEAFVRRRSRPQRRDVGRFDLAILADPREDEPPSDPEALRQFQAAAIAEGFAVEFIDRDDYARVAEFDALFIRETTAVNHRTFRFAQRAEREGLVVIDDPESILRCTNKVFLAEALRRKGIPTPKTIVAHKANLADVLSTIGLPCVLKQPDSSFSQGVVKVDDATQFAEATRTLLRRSDLIVVQEFMPSAYDWRIGVLNRKALYACKYFMARRHWQIIHREGASREEGGVQSVPLESVPKPILDAALSAANLMGDGLYGVDLKEVEGHPYVIEVNDNPSIDAGYEDALLGPALYQRIMADFRRRIERKRGGKDRR